jgi:hypothetical protein
MRQVTPETTQEYMNQLKRFNMGSPGESDCPVFDGMYEYFAVSGCVCWQWEGGHREAAVCQWQQAASEEVPGQRGGCEIGRGCRIMMPAVWVCGVGIESWS